jgi:hypothetical protein
MKINWGLSIIFSFIIFASGIILLVTISLSRDVELVNNNYYEQEIKYQERIDILKNSGDIRSKVELKQTENEIIINFSKYEDYKNLKGEINFYRASDSKKDFQIELKPDENGVQKVSVRDIIKGSWKVRFSVTSEDNKYFFEKELFIQ